MSFKKTTEENSYYDELESMSIKDILSNINSEDKTVPLAVEKALPEIEDLIEVVVNKLKNSGRLFYIGAGTSGRLGVLDASECPPTFGVSQDLVIGLIAGGDKAIREAVENAEDSTKQGWQDLKKHHISSRDIVIGIAASGTTPYVISAIEQCNKNEIFTACITCNANSPLSNTAQLPVEIIVGPEFVTGSSRMKAGTAQKLVLNMITTATMIRLGRIKGNKMIDMQLSNEKLVDRGIKMIMSELDISKENATKLLIKYKSVRKSIEHGRKKRTDKDILARGLKQILICLFLMFSGPTMLHFVLNNKDKSFYYILLTIAIGICVMAIIFLFLGINTILKSIFRD